MTWSMPGSSSSGNMRPQSIAIRSSPDSTSIMLRPISPRPPGGIKRTTGSTELLYVSGASSGGAPAPRRPAARTAPDGVVIVPSGPSPPKFRGRPTTRENGRNVRGGGGRWRERVRLEGRLGLETRDQIMRLAVELGPLAGRDGLAGDEPLAERVHERAVLRHAVVEVGTGGEPGGADRADDLLLLHAHPRMQPRREPRQVVVLGLVARAM